jgi:hypothetical protein
MPVVQRRIFEFRFPIDRFYRPLSSFSRDHSMKSRLENIDASVAWPSPMIIFLYGGVQKWLTWIWWQIQTDAAIRPGRQWPVPSTRAYSLIVYDFILRGSSPGYREVRPLQCLLWAPRRKLHYAQLLNKDKNAPYNLIFLARERAHGTKLPHSSLQNKLPMGLWTKLFQKSCHNTISPEPVVTTGGRASESWHFFPFWHPGKQDCWDNGEESDRVWKSSRLLR